MFSFWTIVDHAVEVTEALCQSFCVVASVLAAAVLWLGTITQRRSRCKECVTPGNHNLLSGRVFRV